MTVSIIVPFDAAGDEQRARNWAWCRQRWETLHPHWELVEHPDPGAGEWSKGRAVNAAVRAASGDVLVIADADVFIVPAVLDEAVRQLARQAPWVVPFHGLYRLPEQVTEAVLTCPLRVTRRLTPTTEQLASGGAYTRGVPGGGIVVCTRGAFDTVGGIDERFTGWGGEDDSFGWALDTLIGPHVRLRGWLWHLWHLRQYAEGCEHRSTPESWALRDRYWNARRDPQAMSALVHST